MRWFYSPRYDYGYGLPGRPREVHGFLLDKPTRIRDRLVSARVATPADFVAPEPLPHAELEAVHSEQLIRELQDPYALARAVELPELGLLPAELLWEAVVAPQLLAAGGTCAALRTAATGGWAINLSGGYHHAGPDLSHGFCLINDVALAVSQLRRAGTQPSILVLDLDLHQGDGNAVAFEGDPQVFTCSMHEENLFPFPKARSDLDVGLPSATGDAEYLVHLEQALDEIHRRFQPEILVYVAGSDPFAGDPLGTLELSPKAMAQRDVRVARFAAELGCALVALPGGGYSLESPVLTAAGFAEIAAVADRCRAVAGSGSRA